MNISYMTSLLTFYLRGEIGTEPNFVTFRNPNTILGLIPLGARTDKVPVDQIASTTVNTKLRIGTLLLGILAVCVGFTAMADSFIGGLIILLFAANWIIYAFETTLVVSMTSGAKRIVFFIVFEKQKAFLAENEINGMIAGRMNDTNVRTQADRIVDAINNK